MIKRLAFLLLTLLTAPPAPAAANTSGFSLKGLGPSGAQVTGVLIAVGVVVGVGVYFIARHPRVTGCLVEDPAGLTLHTDSHSRAYLLTGRTASLQPNQRVKVSGKRRSAPSGQHTFTVESLKRVYGPCIP